MTDRQQAEDQQTVTMTVAEFREHIENATRQGMAQALAEVEGYARQLRDRFGPSVPMHALRETGTGQGECLCGWTPVLGQSIRRAYDRHLADVARSGR